MTEQETKQGREGRWLAEDGLTSGRFLARRRFDNNHLMVVPGSREPAYIWAGREADPMADHLNALEVHVHEAKRVVEAFVVEAANDDRHLHPLPSWFAKHFQALNDLDDNLGDLLARSALSGEEKP